MILADTSVWVDHLRVSDVGLSRLLLSGQAVTHPFILGELALGNLRQRAVINESLGYLPRVTVAADEEVLRFIEAGALFGHGIGYVDAHLLAAVRLTSGTLLWTRDRRLRIVAERLGVAAANA